MAQSRRVFVGNLPHEVTRDEVVGKFKKYGTVESVEIKSKKDPSSGEPLATFSFVNLNTDEETLRNCVFLLNGIKMGGRNIKVEAAKESFLQRLQREREVSQKNATPQPSSASVPQPRPLNIPQKSSANVPKDFVQVKKDKVRNEFPAAKKDSSSPESPDNEDNKSRNKLPMFKGTTSFMSNKPAPIAQSEARNKDSSFLNASKETARNDMKTGRRNSYKPQSNSETSDILKKFESFSDVWKDDDEPSFGSNHAPIMDKRERFETSYNKNSLIVGRGNVQHQKQPPQLGGKQSETSTATTINVAEAKRLKSIDAKREAFEQQKQAVKLALSDQSAPRINKKIVFDDDDDSTNKKQTPLQKGNLIKKAVGKEEEKQKALALFDDDSEDESTADWKKEFQVKKQFEGARGKKLLELQSNFNNDNRFKLDERFYDNDEGSKSKTLSKSEPKTQQSEEVVEGVEGLAAEEREQQLQILSNILGQHISADLPAAHHESKTKGMLRFDPSKPNHLKFELSKEPKEKKRKKKPVATDPEKKNDDEDEDNEEEIGSTKVQREEKDAEPVSQNKFYSVSDSLANSLRQSKHGQGSEFSLLQMFGSSVSESKKNVVEEPRNKLLNMEGLRKRPILDDSSSDEEQEQEEKAAEGGTSVADEAATTSSGPGIVSSHGVWQQSFFIQPDDSRLNEGASFFSQSDNTYDENFAKKREELKKFISRRWHDDWNREPPQKKVKSFQKRASSNKSTMGYRSKKKQRR